MSQPPPNPKPPRLTPCHRHPNLPTTTGLCAPCLHERLSLLTPSTSASTASSSTSTAAAELRRCKTFSAKNCDVVLGVEPRRRSCDVRGRYSLSSLFNLDDNDGENDGVLVQSKNLGFLSRTSGPYPCPWPYPVLEEEEIVEVESEARVRVSNFGNVVGDDDEFGDNSKTMKEFIDLEFKASNNGKSSKSYNRKEFKEIAGSFWIAASVFSKKFRKWGKKQQRSGNESNVGGFRGGGGGGGVGLGEMKLENLRGRRLRDTQSEVGEYGFGRRSCDVDPRGSIDLGRASIDCGGLGRRSCDMDTRGSIDLGRRSCDIDTRGSIDLERKSHDVDTRGSIDLGRKLRDMDTRGSIDLGKTLCDIDARGLIDLERKLCDIDTRSSTDLGRKSCDMDTKGLSDLGRRSCDTDPRFSIDLARVSVDCGRVSVDEVGRNEFDAPRASWDGYLIGGRPTLPRGNVPMVSVIENAMATVYGFDNRVLSEGKVKVDNVSDRERWRNGFDGCSSVKRDIGVIADGEGKGLSNARVSPSAIGIFNGAKLLITEKELNEWRLNSSSLRDDNSSESFETASKDLASVTSSSNGKSFKKCRQWSKLWSIWGLLNRKKGDKEGEGRDLESPDAECVDHNARKLTRNHSSSSSRSSSMVVGSASGTTGRDESKAIVRSRQEAVVLHRNRSARYSPNQLDNGLLRFYLTPLRSRRRNRPGKSRLKNSKSLARSVFRL